MSEQTARELVELLADKLAELDGDMCAVCACTYHRACDPWCAWADWPACIDVDDPATREALIPSDVICSRCASAIDGAVGRDEVIGCIRRARRQALAAVEVDDHGEDVEVDDQGEDACPVCGVGMAMVCACEGCDLEEDDGCDFEEDEGLGPRSAGLPVEAENWRAVVVRIARLLASPGGEAYADAIEIGEDTDALCELIAQLRAA